MLWVGCVSDWGDAWGSRGEEGKGKGDGLLFANMVWSLGWY